MFKKRILKLVLGITSVLLMGGVVYASEGPEPFAEEVIYYRDDETGFISAVYPEREEKEPVKENSSTIGTPVRAMESSYRTVDELIAYYPPTRNQNPYGTCWTFASTACAEFDLINNHGANQYIDLSELQLAYFTYHTANDELGNLDDDYTYIPSGASQNFAAVGGTQDMAINTLAAWKGFSSESALPYSYVQSAINYGLDVSYATMQKEAILTEGYAISMSDRDAVKAAVKEYGALSVSYYADSNFYSSTNGYVTYYYPSAKATNHAVAIVGWDDTLGTHLYTRGYTPSSPGAWLIRNSWTTSTGMSMSSYFWISYEDKTIGQNAYVMNFVPASTYDNIYQHDGVVSHWVWGRKAVANVFTAMNPDGYASEMLDAVMVNMYCEGAEKVKVQVYTGLKDAKDPTSGTLHRRATTEANIMYTGFHTIELNESVPLKPGETYAVVVTAVDGFGYFAVECSGSNSYINSNGQTELWFTTAASADRGESFLNWNNVWYDMVDVDASSSGNVRVKALTTNSTKKAYNISYTLNGGENHKANPYRYCADLGEIKLKTPTKTGYYFQGWYTESTFKNKVTTLSESTSSDLKLYAKWRKMEYKVTLKYENAVYKGEAYKPAVTVKDEYGNTLKKGTDYTVSYENNKNVGVAKVNITFKGLPYKLAKTVRFKIHAKAPTSMKTTLVGYDDVKITWNKSTQADGYKVYFKKSTADKYLYWKSTTGTSLTKSDLADGVKYIFKVVPYFTISDGTKYESTKYATSEVYTLKQITKPTVTTSGDKVKITWKNISGESGYQISKSSTKGKTNIVSTYETTSGTSKSLSSAFGKAYYYKVRAYKKVGDKKIYGPWSTEVKYTRHLAAPSSVKATLYGYDDVKVTWSKVSGAAGYSVYYKKSSDSSYKLKGNTTSLSAKIPDLADGTKYVVKIVPYNKVDGKISRSSNYKATEIYTLKKVTISKVVASDGKMKVSWKNIPGESGYQISQSTTKTGTTIVSTYKTTDGTSKIVSATEGKTLYYKVRAYKIVGDTKVYGPWSDVISAKLEIPREGSITLTGSATGTTSCILKATTYPENAEVTWYTSNPSVAMVSNGTVTAIGHGTAVITAEITYNNKTYSATKEITVTNKVEYGEWTGWTSTPQYATLTREIWMAPLYRYYCFYCPVCGGREPFSGNSDCYQYTLTGGDWREIWVPIPYSQCSAAYWPGTSKMYTYSLGDGLLWNFTAKNLYDTAIGTIDNSGAVVIVQGYNSRSVTRTNVISEVK